ncbi:hypothetical protein WH96_09925 [Kiloniella spongiae]|uniref:Cadherin-like domain-containing protein n=1 Tax=Kiloniella spongiae TaxID=1489064 RepID=A0A0H2MJ54_9PROT|nr:Ig-like domain-containing protein [Kiloniella spongiae]KLN60787.1 hypothetical protein WH96_09925 [Kiloniella spongiae]
MSNLANRINTSDRFDLSPIKVLKPIESETINVSITNGYSANLDFDASTAIPSVEGKDFVLTFPGNSPEEDGGRIVFKNLVEGSQGPNTTVLIINGTEIPAKLLITQTLSLTDADTLETAAGAVVISASGGGSIYNENLGSIIDLLQAQGGILGTDLSFGLLGNTRDALPDIEQSATPSPFQLTPHFETVITSIESEEPFNVGLEDWDDGNRLSPMEIKISFTGGDLTSLKISDIPEGNGAAFFIGNPIASDGTIDYAYEVPTPGGSVTLTPTQLAAGIYLLPPAHSDKDIPLTFQAGTTNTEGDSVTVTTVATAIIDAVADVPIIAEGQESSYSERDEYVRVPVGVQFLDHDGSEDHLIVFSNIPSDWIPAETPPLTYTVTGLEPGQNPGDEGLNTTYELTVDVNLVSDFNGQVNYAQFFRPQGWTSERWSDGTPHDQAPLDAEIGIKAITKETATDLEIFNHNDTAEAETTHLVFRSEDVPSVFGTNITHDETPHIQIDSDDTELLLSDVRTALETSVNAIFSDPLPEPIGQAQVSNLLSEFGQDGAHGATLSFNRYIGDLIYDADGNPIEYRGQAVLLTRDEDSPNIVWGYLARDQDPYFAVHLSTPEDLNDGSNFSVAQVTFVQFLPFDHVYTSNHNDEIDFDLSYFATDNDGDLSDTTAGSTIKIKIRDDGPDANEIQTQIRPDELFEGNLNTDNGNDLGADGGKVSLVIYNSLEYTPNYGAGPGDPAFLISADRGVLKIFFDGSYVYTPNGESGTDEFTYTLRDRDGDTDTDTLSINVLTDVDAQGPSEQPQARLQIVEINQEFKENNTLDNFPETENDDTNLIIFSGSIEELEKQTIMNYDAENGDIIDISDIVTFDDETNLAEDISSYLKVVSTAENNVELLVDEDGDGKDFQTVALLNDFRAGNDIRVILDHDEYTVSIPDIPM